MPENCEIEFMAYVGFVIPTAERCDCHAAATKDKGRIIFFIFIVTPCILETIYYTPTNALLYCNSLKSLH